MPEVTNFKLGICLPLTSMQVPSQFFASFIGIDKPDFDIIFPKWPTDAMGLAEIRNDLVGGALTRGCSHIMMMDTDQIYPENTILRLLNHNLPVVSAAVHRRWEPFDIIMYRGEIDRFLHVTDEEFIKSKKENKLIKIDATGTGCILYSATCFYDIPAPWYENVKSEKGWVGEDITFCSKLRKAGYDIFLDPNVAVDHLTTYIVNWSTYELYKHFNNFNYIPDNREAIFAGNEKDWKGIVENKESQIGAIPFNDF
jgi:hypothetical protein